MSERLQLFTRFERFWHWSQALLIILMLVSGFAIHGSWQVLEFPQALMLHTLAAWALIVLWLFAIFWHFTTGAWRQYLPTMENIGGMLSYYVLGIFTGAVHPYRVSAQHKHNPLQRLAYLLVKLLINPLLWISGLALLYYPAWRGLAGAPSLTTVALLHTLGAFMMLIFFIAHVYLATTGPTPLAYIKAMLRGWQEVERD